MANKINQKLYLVLKPTRRVNSPDERGVRRVLEFTIDRTTKNRPTTKSGEIAVQLNLTIDASLFDKISPVIDVELEEGSLFANVAASVTADAVDEE